MAPWTGTGKPAMTHKGIASIQSLRFVVQEIEQRLGEMPRGTAWLERLLRDADDLSREIGLPAPPVLWLEYHVSRYVLEFFREQRPGSREGELALFFPEIDPTLQHVLGLIFTDPLVPSETEEVVLWHARPPSGAIFAADLSEVAEPVLDNLRRVASRFCQRWLRFLVNMERDWAGGGRPVTAKEEALQMSARLSRQQRELLCALLLLGAKTLHGTRPTCEALSKKAFGRTDGGDAKRSLKALTDLGLVKNGRAVGATAGYYLTDFGAQVAELLQPPLKVRS
jgi:hypothetical protein